MNGLREHRDFLFWNFVFLGTGILQTLMAYHFVVIGFAANCLNCLNAMGNPLGQTLASALQVRRWKDVRWSFPQDYFLVAMACADIGGNVFGQAAVALIGSGLHSVMYCSLVVCNALLGTVLLGKALTIRRWTAVILITMSVILASATQPLHTDEKSWWTASAGVACSLICTCFASMAYVLSNKYLSTHVASQGAPADVEAISILAIKVGLIECSVLLPYFFFYVLPNWKQLVLDPMGANAPPASMCFAWYAVYLVIGALHQYGFYYCLSFSNLAAVTSGVNKTIQAAVLFFASSALFCNIAPAQCITRNKMYATIGVCFGVLLYASDDFKLLLYPGMAQEIMPIRKAAGEL
eukprot:TRINITY_DN57606_c0_g1_i1.p1 TRINITY_DN57606_c0_g1~~TRINITY_DN57606_c0_g1_i1.p1  ORF type:complete len:352 (-),score=33.18 TRINITY_DN57606_c0_g1_i1:178-1233(-)